MESRLPFKSAANEASGPDLGACAHAPAAHSHPGQDICVTCNDNDVSGALSPRLVIRGESFNHHPSQLASENPFFNEESLLIRSSEETSRHHDGIHDAALTDYVRCTFPFEPDSLELAEITFSLVRYLGPDAGPIINLGKGLDGYTSSYEFGTSSARFAFGGQNSTALLDIPGAACALVSDWVGFRSFLEHTLKARLTRWDGAVDDFEGTHTVDMAVDMYKAGLFKSGGRNPAPEQRGNWLEPDGSGRTFYVGKRKNGKVLRVYEKGMQLGAKWHPWVRWEVEFHREKREIPWDVLTAPGSYVRGAYPKALDWVCEKMERIRTIKAEAEISYETLTQYASLSYGKHLAVMEAVEGSPQRVLEKLKRDGLPARLAHPMFHQSR